MPQLRIQVAVDAVTVYGRDVLRGVSRYGRQTGNWSISISPREELWNLRYAEGFDGRVVQAFSSAHGEQLKADKTPFVNVGDMTKLEGLPTVISDHREIGRTAAEHFLARGFRNLAVFGSTDHWYAQQRRDGFVHLAASAGIHVEQYWESGGHRTSEPLRQWVRSLQRPVGVLGCHDGMARDLATACFDVGLRVPEDVAVLGVDNDEMICELGDPPLSSVAIAAQRIGYEAAEVLDHLIRHEPVPPRPIIIPPLSVVTRRSTDVLATIDPHIARAVQFIRGHSGQTITVDDVANSLGISRRQLEQRFQRNLGRSPASEIRRTHVERIKNLLETTDAPLSQIAANCGLADGPSLSRFFHRETGLTPSEYRNRLRVGR